MPVEGSFFKVKDLCCDRKYWGDNFNPTCLLLACRWPKGSQFIIAGDCSHGCKPHRPALRFPCVCDIFKGICSLKEYKWAPKRWSPGQNGKVCLGGSQPCSSFPIPWSFFPQVQQKVFSLAKPQNVGYGMSGVESRAQALTTCVLPWISSLLMC